MALKEKFNADIKEAMKAKDANTLGTLRMLVAVVNNEEIEKRATSKPKRRASALHKIAKKLAHEKAKKMGLELKKR